MDDKPVDKEKILKELSEFHKLDYDYSDGRILGSMCTEAHPFAKEVYFKFLDTNLGDPGLFKGTKLIECEVIKSIGELLSIDNPYGHIVTGGTEANLMAIRAARNHARKYKGIIDGEIIVPESAHFSFKKAADMLNLKIVEAELDENYKTDVESVKKLISDKTVAIVAIAGTTELGLVDPIDEISKIALENNIYFHVDAAFGGFSIPFLRKIGFDLPVFDFSLPGVCSITVDPHKMGLAPIPAGGILFRKEEYLEVMAVDSPYLTVKTQSTIVGTRLGASSAATYAIMKYFGKEGYCNIIRNLMDNTIFFKEELEKLGYEVICEPELNIVAFNHPSIETNELAEKLGARGWKVSVAKCPVAIRIVLMNHIKLNHLKELLEDLKEIF
ncbi:L-tyrosine decarboxylase [Methanobrevibacter sp. YE315]|uniref:tyrosine decarboxylase MfnA n=1 Tax=Methanobrevibacter sp. YE315 TaxID=1609968 RepID=UPI000764DCFF|nr:tyrosine decarboxylase MfnA [Methanobrevibacter sp. YE315]AMD18175.1 L-tyrosine decarboxylase [Methanobrevibacter sp. YE315]